MQGLLSRLGDTDRVAFDELIKAELTAMDGAGERVVLDGTDGVRLRSVIESRRLTYVSEKLSANTATRA